MFSQKKIHAALSVNRDGLLQPLPFLFYTSYTSWVPPLLCLILVPMDHNIEENWFDLSEQLSIISSSLIKGGNLTILIKSTLNVKGRRKQWTHRRRKEWGNEEKITFYCCKVLMITFGDLVELIRFSQEGINSILPLVIKTLQFFLKVYSSLISNHRNKVK